jgi:protein subunit release factor B
MEPTTDRSDDEALRKLLAECDVETYRGSGPGGQHRNRRDSAVRLTHRPTGIVVTATERRSQHQNRAVALERLAAKLAARRRRRRPRIATKPTAAAASRRIAGKKRRSEIKSGRRAGPGEEDAG